jgi:hypothetical protein
MASTNPTPYAARAENHWKRFRPGDYQKIPPEQRAEFFNRIGNDIEDQILARTEQLTLAQQPEPDSGYMDSLATTMTIAGEAKRQVLDEMLPAPEDTGEQETKGQQETAGN